MASKNPAKGFIYCHMPDCSHIATVHAVGEHRIMSEGSPPKNKRNTGRLYYNCPSCGFQQGKGGAFQEHITQNMKLTKAELIPVETKPHVVLSENLKPVIEPVNKPVSVEPIFSSEPVQSRFETVKPYFYALILITTLIFLVRKKEQQPNG